MLINHCHTSFRGFGMEPEDPEIGTLPALQGILSEVGVDRAIAFAPFGQQGQEWEESGGGIGRNEWLCRELEKYPNLSGFASVYPQDHDAPQQLRRAIEMGLVGAKVHPPVMQFRPDDPAIDGFWQMAEELQIPVSIHTGVHGWFLRNYMPLVLDNVAQRHPKLPIIIEHIGGAVFFDQGLAVILNNENCYAGLTQSSGRAPSFAISPERIKLLLDTVGAGRIIYGLDYPWNPKNVDALRYDIEWIRSWDISDEDKERILGGNLEALIR